MCERLAQGRYSAMRRPGVESATCWLQVQRPNHYTSESHSVDSSRALAWSWTLLSQMLWGRPSGLLQLAIGFLPSYVSTIGRRASYAGTPGSRRATWLSHHRMFVVWLLHAWLGVIAVGRWTYDHQVTSSKMSAAPLSSATLGKLLTHTCLCHQAV